MGGNEPWKLKWFVIWQMMECTVQKVPVRPIPAEQWTTMGAPESILQTSCTRRKKPVGDAGKPWSGHSRYWKWVTILASDSGSRVFVTEKARMTGSAESSTSKGSTRILSYKIICDSGQYLTHLTYITRRQKLATNRTHTLPLSDSQEARRQGQKRTLEDSISCVSITITRQSCSHTIRQKSFTVFETGPCVAIYLGQPCQSVC